jgi:hypothetical protein
MKTQAGAGPVDSSRGSEQSKSRKIYHSLDCEKKSKQSPNESQTSKQKEVTFEQRQCNATGADARRQVKTR